ncbi:MAG: PAS domain-containing protein [Anaerolineales bacterium]
MSEQLFAVIVTAVIGIVGWFGNAGWASKYLRKSAKCVNDILTLHEKIELIDKIHDDLYPDGKPSMLGAIKNASALAILTRNRVDVLEEASHIPVIVTDESGSLVWANLAYCNLVGLQLDRVKGFNWSNAIHQDDRESVVKGWRDAVENSSDWIYRFRYWSFAKSQEIWVMAKCRAAINPATGKPAGWIATIEEIEDPTIPKDECGNRHFIPPLDSKK